jgi:hypothetical protein
MAKFAAARAEMVSFLDDLQDSKALRSPRELCSNAAQAYVELSAQKTDIERVQSQAKGIIADYLEQEGTGEFQDAKVKVMVSAPYPKVYYDADKLDALVIELTQSHPEMAARIAASRTTREIAGSLRVTRRTNF